MWERDWNLELAYWKSFPVSEKTMRPISASQRLESSKAFLKSPLLLFENVTCLAVVLSIFLIWIFLLGIFPDNRLSDPFFFGWVGYQTLHFKVLLLSKLLAQPSIPDIETICIESWERERERRKERYRE